MEIVFLLERSVQAPAASAAALRFQSVYGMPLQGACGITRDTAARTLDYARTTS